jgi:hypothetical protein
VVDYFLFDLRQGYCDYYATAMVVLARAAGLPARLVVGYASGTYDPATATYQIQADDAHSWVELYFPSLGWVVFEPTAGLPALQRTDQPAMATPPPPVTTPEPGPVIISLPKLIGWIVLTSLALAYLALLVSYLDRRRLKKLPPTFAVAEVYRRLYRSASALTSPLSPADTPNEWNQRLLIKIKLLARSAPWSAWLYWTPRDTSHLTEMYNQAVYSADGVNAQEREQGIQIWGRLRLRLWLARWGKYRIK